MLSENYMGCQIFIHDEKGELITKTKIIGYDSPLEPIVIRGRYPNVKSGSQVNVLILAKSGVHEYHGRIRNYVLDSLASEITLFQGKLKESREAGRYRINSEAVINAMAFDELILPLLNPIEVSVENLSATGALLKASPNCFAIGSVLQMELVIGSEDTDIRGRIVRVKDIGDNSAEYGCKFIFDTSRESRNEQGVEAE